MGNLLQFPLKHPDYCSHQDLVDQFRYAVHKVKQNPETVKNFSHIWRAMYHRAQTETLKTIAKQFMVETVE
jgi:hypothetical protein